MILGKHHELTLISDMREYQHTNLCTSEQLFQITSAYETIASFLQSQKIQFYYMQCWDNFSIYPERYPDNIKVFGDCSRTQQIEDALASETISFSENGNFGDYVIEGFADPEKDGAWVEGDRMALLLSLSSGINQQKISCSVKICSVLGQKGQQVRVSVNGLACADARMTKAGDLTFSFDRPPSDYVLLHFELPDAVSPLDLGESGDSRKLSLKISALELS